VEIVSASLEPEVESLPSDRTDVDVKKEGDHLILEIRATDIVALRAGINSYLRWIEGILDMIDTIS
jgi:KEOPS complex subunit Pcc1